VLAGGDLGEELPPSSLAFVHDARVWPGTLVLRHSLPFVRGSRPA
jgi:hypothetical protein